MSRGSNQAIPNFKSGHHESKQASTQLAIRAEMAAKHPAPAIFGRVDYEHSSGNRYWTTVCRYYEIAFQLLASCPNGNAVGRK
jgi:hypothetical protein